MGERGSGWDCEEPYESVVVVEAKYVAYVDLSKFGLGRDATAADVIEVLNKRYPKNPQRALRVLGVTTGNPRDVEICVLRLRFEGPDSNGITGGGDQDDWLWDWECECSPTGPGLCYVCRTERRIREEEGA